jgi:hypothetical protein
MSVPGGEQRAGFELGWLGRRLGRRERRELRRGRKWLDDRWRNELAVEAADALAAFHHPYAYTVDRQPARHTHTT